MKALALVLLPAIAFAEAQPQAPQQPPPQPQQPPDQNAPPPPAPQPRIATAGVVGRWMFTDSACTTSTDWVFNGNGTGESQKVAFKYERTRANRYHLVWVAQNIAQDYELVVDGNTMTSFLLNSEPRICHWKRTP